MNLTTSALEIEAEIGGFNVQEYLTKIQDIARVVEPRIHKAGAAETISQLNKYIFNEQGFETGGLHSLFFYQLFDTRKGNCYSLSLLYLGVSEHLGLPVKPVLAPQHIFLRWSDSKNTINIETTDQGTFHTNSEYVLHYRIDPLSIKKGIYLKNIGTRTMAALAFDRRSNFYQEMGDLEKALEDSNKAINLDPKFPIAYTNRAGIYISGEHFDAAYKDYSMAISLDPGMELNYIQRGTFYFNKGSYELAFRDFTSALKINPTEHTLMLRGACQFVLKNYPGALITFTAGLSLDPVHVGLRIRRGYVFAIMGEYDRANQDLAIEIPSGVPDENNLRIMKDEAYEIIHST